MIKPGTKYIVLTGSTLVAAGTVVTSPSLKEWEKGICFGTVNSEAVQMTLPTGGALFFTPEQLKESA